MHYNVAYKKAVLYLEACKYTGSYVNVHRGSVSQFWNRHYTFYVYTHRIGTTAYAKDGARLTIPSLHRNGKTSHESDHTLGSKYHGRLIQANVCIMCDNDSSLTDTITKNVRHFPIQYYRMQ